MATLRNLLPRRSLVLLVLLTGIASVTQPLGVVVGQEAEQGYSAEPPPVPVMSQRQLYCMQLEQRLQRENRGEQNARDSLPRIESEIYRTARSVERLEAQAERLDCFDYFLFAKEWRQSPRCIKARQQLEGTQQSLRRLTQQRDQIANGQVQETQVDALITELARNRCGPQYVQEARRRSNQNSFFWDDSEGDPGFGANTIPQPTYSTYRTLCVRTCDGYYYPISFATTQTTFQRDANMCQAQCAAPARLFIYQNPGAEIEQAVSADGEMAYSQLPNAFRYRRELVKGCSCKPEEYDSALFPDTAATASISASPDGGLSTDPNASLAVAAPGQPLFQGDESAPVPKQRPRKRVPLEPFEQPKYLR